MRRTALPLPFLAIVAAAVGVGLLAPAGPVAAAAGPDVVITPVVRATGLQVPTQVVAANDGTSRLFVAEKRGVIRVFTGSGMQGPSYLDIRSKVATEGERGLLGVAFAPQFRISPYLWVTYTRKGDGALVVSRFTAPSATARQVYGSTERIVFVVPRPSATTTNHNGGAIVFGKDNLLYISTGDGGSGGDPYNTAQRGLSLNGKILRINVNRACKDRAYCIPESNPYYLSTQVHWVTYSLGWRNPWRMSVDPVTGALWAGDVGQNRWEEVNVVSAGANYGWSCKEGDDTYDSSRCGAGTLTAPTFAYCHPGEVVGCTDAIGGDSITGGHVYRGSWYSSVIAGRYLFGDFINGNLWVGVPGDFRRAGNVPSISSFGVDDGGELWAVTISGSTNGTLVRLSVRSVV
jgi:glucose/arabinose dehydrogenase